MTFYAISALVNTLTSIVLGFLILFSNPRKELNVTFFLAAFSVATWSLFYFLWQIAVDATSALYYVHLLMAASIFISPTYFHFVASHIHRTKELRTWIAFGYAQAILFFIFNWSPLFVASVQPKGGFPFWPEPGMLYHVFLLVSWAFIIAAAVLLFRYLKKADGEEQGRTKYILIATLIGYIGGYTNYFLWYNVPIPPIGNISTSIYIAFVAYAILRHRLFNMKVLATELLTFSLWLFIVVRVFLSNTQEEQFINGGLLMVSLVIGTLLIRSVDKEVETRLKVEILAKDLEKANVRLKELDRQKSEFIGIAAHQLRTPIAAIKGYSSLILEGSYGKLTKQMHDVTKTIFDSSDRMADTIADFLNVTRIEQGRMEYNKKPLDLLKTVEGTVATFALSAKEKGLQLDFDHEEADQNSYIVFADLGKIQHVVNNLLDNAIKYTPKGSVHVTLSSDVKSKVVRMTVTDTGSGISKEAIAGLFEKFVRAPNAKSVNVNGSGLGLFVAKQMVEAHGGKIWAESEGEGKGATFIFELPLATETEKAKIEVSAPSGNIAL